MELEFGVLACIAVGIFAHKVRGRKGGVWGLGTLSIILFGHAFIVAMGGSKWLWNMLVIAGAVLLLLGMKSLKGTTPESTSFATSKDCPFCAEPIKAAAIVCNHCGKDLPSQSASA